MSGGVSATTILTATMVAATAASTAMAVMSQQQAGALANSQGQAQNVAAQEQQQAANYQAQELQTAAGQDQAASQRVAQAQRQQEGLVLSADRAAAAGSGTTGSDPSVVTLEGQVGARGEYNALSDLYTGNEQAQEKNTQAALDRYTGQEYAQGGQFAAESGGFRRSMANVSSAGTIFGGIGQGASLYAKYGMPGPNNETAINTGLNEYAQYGDQYQ